MAIIVKYYHDWKYPEDITTNKSYPTHLHTIYHTVQDYPVLQDSQPRPSVAVKHWKCD